MTITPAQCRAARALLGITQKELKARANVSVSTITNFEKNGMPLRGDTLADIARALEQAGAFFIDEGAGVVGVRLRKASEI